MTNQDYTHIAFIADRSGSMHGIHTDMNGAIKELLANQAKEEGVRMVDVWTFDNEVEHPFVNVPIADVGDVDIIHPRGSTALNDALGKTIVELGERFAAMPEHRRPGNVIIVVVTDGMENASREYTLAAVNAMVKTQTDEFGWVFMYLAANVDVESTARDYGFDGRWSSGYATTASGVGNTATGLHANMSRVAKGDRTGFTEEERTAMTDD